MDTINQLNKFVNKWSVQYSFSNDHIDLFKSYLNITNESTLDEINDAFENEFDQLFDIRDKLIENKLIPLHTDDSNETHLDNEKQWNKIVETIHYTRNCVIGFHMTSKVTCPDYSFDPKLDTTLYKYNTLIQCDLKPYQEMLFYVLLKFSEHKYKRYNGCCYTSIKTKKGYDTLAWRKVDTIENCIYSLFNKSTNLNMFLKLTKTKDTMRSLVNHMEKAEDNQFKPLIKNRHVFSFKNGVYVTKVWNDQTEWWSDKFYKYTDNDFPSHLTSSKYFDVNLDCSDENDPRKIVTPLLDSIFKYQDLPQDVIIWNKVYLGRLLYDVDELDNWQTIMFYLGQGGTGKSTINNFVAKQFYDDQDVAIMSNNIQTKFGLSDIHDKFLFIAPEIKRDWGIEQSEFQEIVSGGTLNINVKYKQSEVIDWKTPGILGGNENPDFIDNSGSIKRRIVVTRFDKKVKCGDTMLGKKLQNEIPNILKQCNMFYQEHAKIYSRDDGSDIWSHLPSYFIETQQKMNEATSSLANFMNSGKLKFGSDCSMSEIAFKHYFKLHCNENNIKQSWRWNADFYQSHFNNHNIVIVKKNNKNVLMGVDIHLEEDIEDQPIQFIN